jgi:hypothetical protein
VTLVAVGDPAAGQAYPAVQSWQGAKPQPPRLHFPAPQSVCQTTCMGARTNLTTGAAGHNFWHQVQPTHRGREIARVPGWASGVRYLQLTHVSRFSRPSISLVVYSALRRGAANGQPVLVETIVVTGGDQGQVEVGMGRKAFAPRGVGKAGGRCKGFIEWDLSIKPYHVTYFGSPAYQSPSPVLATFLVVQEGAHRAAER